MTFVDTSAFVASLDRKDINYPHATGVMRQLVRERISLLCTNYVLVETIAVLQRKFGFDAVLTFHNDDPSDAEHLLD